MHRSIWQHGLRFLAHVLFASLSVTAQTIQPGGPGEAPPVLVELFTSEGCSSCPPADTLLREVNGKKSRTGRWVVGISEHVTYWNNLGWSDPFSSESYTARQSAYADRFHLGSVYTPQMVIDGAEQIVGSDRAGLERALGREGARPRMTLRIVSAEIVDGVLRVSFSAGDRGTERSAEIIAVLADDMDRSSVLRGENSGQTLAHVSVARSLTRVATIQGAVEKVVQLPIPAGFQAGRGGHHLILFAQSEGQGQVLAVTSRPI